MTTRAWVAPWTVFAVFAVVTAAQGTGVFLYDADHYWQGTQAALGLTAEAPSGYWGERGVFTAFVYAPAAAFVAIAGAHLASFAVLVQNALVLGAFAAFLLPELVRRWTTVTIGTRVVGAVLVWLVTAKFAPYSLVDVYPAMALVAVIVLLQSRRVIPLLAAGVIAGAALNVRPSYLVVVGLVAGVVIAWRRWSGLLFPAGVALALVPQVIVNLVSFSQFSLVPVGTDKLIALQTGYAAYTVRYDTFFGEASARQFYCSPDMAALVGNHPPGTAGELALTFLQTLPTSLVFSLQKIGAALRWPLSTPYTIPQSGVDTIFPFVIAVIAVVGIGLAMYRFTRRDDDGRRDWFGFSILTVIVLGVLVTLVSAATESRFALPLLLLGAAGLASLAGTSPRRVLTVARPWTIATVVLTIVVIALGYWGLAHPAPRGDVSAAICAEG